MHRNDVKACPGGLLGYGAGIADLVARVPFAFLERYDIRKGDAREVPPETMKQVIAALPESPSQLPGGATANTLYAFAGLGGRAGMLSRFGKDEAGDMLLQHLRSADVDCSRVRVAQAECTGCCLVLITPDSERSMLTMQGAFAGIGPDTFSLQDFSGYTHFYMEGYSLYFPETALRILQLAREAGLCVCYDMGSPNIVRTHLELLKKILSEYVDVVFANEQENQEFTVGTGNKPVALSQYCPVAVVKYGAAGAVIHCRGKEKLEIPAVAAAVRDTTGAGDCWAAGFLRRWLAADGNMMAAGRMGAATAAAVIEISGADLPLNQLKKIEEMFL